MIDFFKKIIEVLNKHSIAYMLSGSVAMSLYIIPRSTRDFDFIVNLHLHDINLFADEFQENYYCDKDAIADAISRHGMFNIIDHASGFKADFVILKNSAFRQEEFNRRVQIDYFGETIYIVTAEDLLISKLIWIQDFQSAVQMEDIRNLMAAESMNWDYIDNWILQLKLNTFNLLNG